MASAPHIVYPRASVGGYDALSGDDAGGYEFRPVALRRHGANDVHHDTTTARLASWSNGRYNLVLCYF